MVSPMRFSWVREDPVTKSIHSPIVLWFFKFKTRTFRPPSPKMIFIVSRRERGLLCEKKELHIPFLHFDIILLDFLWRGSNPFDFAALFLRIEEVGRGELFSFHPILLREVQFILVTHLFHTEAYDIMFRSVAKFIPLFCSRYTSFKWTFE